MVRTVDQIRVERELRAEILSHKISKLRVFALLLILGLLILMLPQFKEGLDLVAKSGEGELREEYKVDNSQASETYKRIQKIERIRRLLFLPLAESSLTGLKRGVYLLEKVRVPLILELEKVGASANFLKRVDEEFKKSKEILNAAQAILSYKIKIEKLKSDIDKIRIYIDEGKYSLAKMELQKAYRDAEELKKISQSLNFYFGEKAKVAEKIASLYKSYLLEESLYIKYSALNNREGKKESGRKALILSVKISRLEGDSWYRDCWLDLFRNLFNREKWIKD